MAKIRYKVLSMRLHEGTIEKLKKEKEKLGNKSWNKFIYHLIVNYEKNKKN